MTALSSRMESRTGNREVGMMRLMAGEWGCKDFYFCDEETDSEVHWSLFVLLTQVGRTHWVLN